MSSTQMKLSMRSRGNSFWRITKNGSLIWGPNGNLCSSTWRFLNMLSVALGSWCHIMALSTACCIARKPSLLYPTRNQNIEHKKVKIQMTKNSGGSWLGIKTDNSQEVFLEASWYNRGQGGATLESHGNEATIRKWVLAEKKKARSIQGFFSLHSQPLWIEHLFCSFDYTVNRG